MIPGVISTQRVVAPTAAVDVYPTFRARVNGSATGSNDMTLDFSASFVAGDRALLFVSSSGTGAITTPSGWTKVGSTLTPSGARGNIYYRDLIVGDTTVVVQGTTRRLGTMILWMTGTYATAVAPSVGVISSGSSTTPNATSVTGGGVFPHTFMTFYCADNEAFSQASVYPYPDNNFTAASGGGVGTDNLSYGFCSDEILASIDDPGSFTVTASVPWGAVAIAIRGIPA